MVEILKVKYRPGIISNDRPRLRLVAVGRKTDVP